MKRRESRRTPSFRPGPGGSSLGAFGCHLCSPWVLLCLVQPAGPDGPFDGSNVAAPGTGIQRRGPRRNWACVVIHSACAYVDTA